MSCQPAYKCIDIPYRKNPEQDSDSLSFAQPEPDDSHGDKQEDQDCCQAAPEYDQASHQSLAIVWSSKETHSHNHVRVKLTTTNYAVHYALYNFAYSKLRLF